VNLSVSIVIYTALGHSVCIVIIWHTMCRR